MEGRFLSMILVPNREVVEQERRIEEAAKVAAEQEQGAAQGE
jgi:hypothetical protein